MNPSREIVVKPAKHRCNDNPSKNYGISSPRLIWTLKRGGEAISWELITDWGMPDEAFHAAVPDCTHPAHQGSFPTHKTSSGPVDFHFAEDVLGGMSYREHCMVLDGPCFSDVGFLIGDVLFDLLRVEGSEAVWNEMRSMLLGYRAELSERAS